MASPMPIPMNVDPIAPAPVSAPVRPAPPRPAPSPTREPPMASEQRPMPPLGAPLPGDGPVARSRPPLGGRPGGTMPPPIAPIPPPGASPAMLDAAPPPPASLPMPSPLPAPMPVAPSAPVSHAAHAAHAAPVAPSPMATVAMPPQPAVAAPVSAPAPAPVVPLPAEKNKGRQLVGAGARKVVGRAVSMPSRRGVDVEPLDPKVVKMLDLQSNILERLRAKLDLDKIPMERLHEEELLQRAERATIDLVETLETSGELPKYIDQDLLIKETLSEALAFGPLEDLLADENVDEIIIDRRDRVVVGKNGQLRGSGKAFSSDEVFERVVKRLVADAGATIDESSPIVDLRMRDGTRLTAAVAPVASRGACLVLKKPASAMPQLADLGSQGAMSPGMADFLATCVTARRNILVCGGPGSGKTTIVGAIAAASPAGERVISVEEIGELSLSRDEWIQLETRIGIGKAADIDMATLLETALRLAPDRLVVGEVRGREALPLVHALNAQVDGAVVAMTGEGANAALSRLATLARSLSPSGIDHEGAIRELVAQAFEIIVHVARWTDGSLRVMSIEEVSGYADTGFETTVLFQFREGAFQPTGSVPRFYAELEARGIPADQAVFR